MTDMVIDKGLIEFLGLPDDYQLDKFEAFKFYEFIHKIYPCDNPVRSWTLEHYVDHRGDFVNKPKNKFDNIAKAIFDNLEKSDQFEVLQYIEYWRETDGFIDFSEFRD